MGYTAPTTRATGYLVTAANWNTDLVDNITFLANPPACRVYHSVNQSITHGALTTLAFNSERYDTASLHDTVTNNSRITIPVAGIYTVTTHVVWQADTDYTRRIVDILLNGATLIARKDDESPGHVVALDEGWALTTAYKFAVNDYVEVRVFQQNTSVGANNVMTFANYSPEFAATWIGLG